MGREPPVQLQESTYVQQWNCCIRKDLALCHRNYGCPTVRPLDPSISLQD